MDIHRYFINVCSVPHFSLMFIVQAIHFVWAPQDIFVNIILQEKCCCKNLPNLKIHNKFEMHGLLDKKLTFYKMVYIYLKRYEKILRQKLFARYNSKLRPYCKKLQYNYCKILTQNRVHFLLSKDISYNAYFL